MSVLRREVLMIETWAETSLPEPYKTKFDKEVIDCPDEGYREHITRQAIAKGRKFRCFDQPRAA